MISIGTDVTIPIEVKVAGALIDPASITVDTTAPDGTPDTITPSRLSLGTYEAIVSATAAGRWLFAVTTQDPDRVEHSYFDVQADPPPPDRLMPLATLADLEDRATLTDAQKLRAPALLRDASAKIRGYTRQDFDLTLNDVRTLRPVGSALRLPQRPVLAVDQVAQVGTAGTPDRVMAGTEWAWDGIDKIELWPEAYRCQWPTVTGTYADAYRVTNDHGYAVTPDFIVGFTCDLVLRVLLVPTQVAGMQSENIGQYSYRLAAGAPGTKVTLTEDDKRELREAGYRRTAGTVQLRTG